MPMRLFHTLLIAATATALPSFPLFYSANDARIQYHGRWAMDGSKAQADWPCVGLEFSIHVNADQARAGFLWHGPRTRIRVTVSDVNTGETISDQVVSGPFVSLPFDCNPCTHNLDFPQPGIYKVFVRKLTTSAPYGSGLGRQLISPSIVNFFGVTLAGAASLGAPPPRATRRVQFIGASDTAGYCVDGSADTGSFMTILDGWRFENCDSGNVGNLGRELEAEISVQAISGIGLTQNANAKQQWQLGPLSMPGYFNRTMMSQSTPVWDFETWGADLVVVSLGGNDFNHQGNNVPSNATFSQKYENFLLDIFKVSPSDTAVVSICGQGSPGEEAFDPDNNRCRPCPHVDDANQAFTKKHGGKYKTDYIFVPCDGSVMTGKGDVGCDGHKNRLGQAEVSRFLAPKLKQIMSWS